MTVRVKTAGMSNTARNPERGEWVTQAKCRKGDPDALFVRGAEQRKAAVICRHCPVLTECRADALDNRVEFGVWGWLTERQTLGVKAGPPRVLGSAGDHYVTGNGIDEVIVEIPGRHV